MGVDFAKPDRDPSACSPFAALLSCASSGVGGTSAIQRRKGERNMSRRRRLGGRTGAWIGIVLAAAVVGNGAANAQSHWPQWRGPRGDGHAAAAAPTKWSAESTAWKSALPGVGQSSPAIWGERMFLTSALENGRRRIVFCISLRDGRLLWQQEAWTGEPEKSHAMNGWASPTCATDGEIVVAFFGKGGLHAWTVDGKRLWSRELGEFESPWGTAACPILVGESVVQNGDSDRDAFIEAFDKRTGKTVWRQPRPAHRGWSTPLVWRQGDRTLLVLNGHAGVSAYDPATGREVWFSKNASGRGEPTVTPGDEFLYVVCGLAGNMRALRPAVDGAAPAEAWTAPRRGGRDLPSPLVVGDYLFVSSMNGIATCYEARTGKELWKERLEGQFSSSPVAAGGLVYHQNEAGRTYVIEPGPALKIVAQNELPAGPDELFRASLAVVDGRIYIRSNQTLYCIGPAAR